MQTCFVSLTVAIHDHAALARAVRRHAVDVERMQKFEWQRLRREHPGGPVCADLLMLLDPGESTDGVEIISGEAREA